MLKTETEKAKATTKKATASATTTRRKSASASPRKSAAIAATGEATPRPMPTQEEIARRAYELYLARGGRGGSATEDWLEAERELSNGNGRSQDAAPLKR